MKKSAGEINAFNDVLGIGNFELKDSLSRHGQLYSQIRFSYF